MEHFRVAVDTKGCSVPQFPHPQNGNIVELPVGRWEVLVATVVCADRWLLSLW